MIYDPEITRTLNSLKDFQRATVDYTVGAINNGQQRFLIADEVGLGKTIIAKGIIARLYRQEYKPDRDFTVVYICSNQALARQNLSKLNIFDDDRKGESIDYSEQDDRLTSLAYLPLVEKTQRGFRIKALTPSTSFDTKSRAGKADERILLLRLLASNPHLKTRKVALTWFLRGGKKIKETNWKARTDQALAYERKPVAGSGVRQVRTNLYKAFHDFMDTTLPLPWQEKVFGAPDNTATYRSALEHILPENKRNRSYEDGKDDVFNKYYSLITELRLGLSHLCKEYLSADLFILDEFQRFSHLISNKGTYNAGEEIARTIFANPKSRTLLLSATPFKAYTNSLEQMQGEDHYTEFKSVLQFLKDKEKPEFWEDLDRNNSAFFRAMRHFPEQAPEDLPLMELKAKIESIYRKCIVRTERILVEDVNNSSHSQSLQILSVHKNDVDDYLALHKIIQQCNTHTGSKLSNAIEYVKSSPFPLSFLQDYEHYNAILKAYPNSPEIAAVIKASKKAFVPTQRLVKYNPILESSVNEPNPKLRLLYEQTFRSGGYKLLWIPPSLPYYDNKKSAFYKNADFSKTLIFSSWKMVPRMVSSLVSYEAERLSIGSYIHEKNLSNKHTYTETDRKRRFPYPLLTFRETDKGFSGMNALLLAYASPYLAQLYDPAVNLIEKKSLAKIKKQLSKKIESDLRKTTEVKSANVTTDLHKWSWLAVVCLDKSIIENYDEPEKWYVQPSSIMEDDDGESKSAKQSLYNQLYKSFDTLPDNLGSLTEEQLNRTVEFLTELCLGGPAIAALRSLRKAYPGIDTTEIRQAAQIIGEGFLSLFNKPESIAVVKVASQDDSYYRNVLDYSIAGNIQSLLDEFIPQLSESSGIGSPLEAANLIRDILTVSSGKVEIINQQTFSSNKTFPIRTHYAVPFGTAASSNLSSGKREVKVREAFNSPFRPFVLTSTSIGQEGLDFHLYCNNIIHWNLPSNPIDLEQREGRIKRYKSHLIRKSVAKSHGSKLEYSDLQQDLWKPLFEYAHKDSKVSNQYCDLVPFWHPHGTSGKINVTIPIYPFSRDQEKYNYIISVLSGYRLTFGQPRQEELVEALGSLSASEQEILRKALINLSPITY